MAKQVQTRTQKEIDEEFLSLAEKNLKKDKSLLKRLAEERA